MHQNSLSYLAGVGAAVTLGVSITFLVAKGLGAATGSTNTSSGNQTVDYVIIALLLALLIHTFLNRRNVTNPKWMSRLQTATPRFALLLGLVLFLVMPTDVITMITVGSFEAAQRAPWWHNLYLVALTVLLVSIPYVLVLALGRRAHVVAPEGARLDDVALLGRQRGRDPVLLGAHHQQHRRVAHTRPAEPAPR